MVVTGGTWTSSNALFVGFLGAGSLDINGGYVRSTDYSALAWVYGSNGTATVTSGTSFADTFHVGYGGAGSSVGGVGMATVSSGTWAARGDFTVGALGTGTLTMNGGLVNVGGVLSQGGSGTINLNAGGFSGNFSSVVWTGLADGQSAIFNASTGYVSISVIPEPSTVALVAVGGGLAAFTRWRRRPR